MKRGMTVKQPMECVYRSSDPTPLDKRRHYHTDQIEIIQLVEGRGSYLIGDALYPMTPGAVYFIDAEHFHCSLPDRGGVYCRNKLVMNKSDLYAALGAVGGADCLDRLIAQRVCVREQGRREEIDRLFCRIQYETGQNRLFQTALAVLELIALCADTASNGDSAKRETGAVYPALEYIKNHLAEPFSLDELCRGIHVSKSYLCHRFRDEVKMTVMEYLRVQRMIRACELLRQTDLPVSEIAAECGFSGLSHFSTSFKKEFGCSPREYRKANGVPPQ